jgi:hypothetical protein
VVDHIPNIPYIPAKSSNHTLRVLVPTTDANANADADANANTFLAVVPS